MAEVIYLPPTEGVGEAIGKGLGAAAISGMQAYEQKQYMERVQALEKAISSQNISRSQAMELHAKFPYRDIQESQAGIQFINEAKPVALEQPEKIPVWDQTTGAETFKYIKKKDVPLFTPPEGQTLTKPVTHDYYKLDTKDPNAIIPVGTFSEGQQPSGTVSKDQVDVLHGAQALQVQAQQLIISQKKLDNDIRKAAKDNNTEFMNQLKSLNGVIASRLNMKKTAGPEGVTYTFDFDNPKASNAYSFALDNAADYLKKYNGDIDKAGLALLRDGGYFDTKLEAAPVPAAPKEPTAWDSLQSKAKQLFGDKPAQTTAKPEAKPSASTKPKFEVGKTYTDAKGNKAIYQADGTWKEAK